MTHTYAIADLPSSHPPELTIVDPDQAVDRIRHAVEAYDGWAIAMSTADLAFGVHHGADIVLTWTRPPRSRARKPQVEHVAVKRPAGAEPHDGALLNVHSRSAALPYQDGKPDWWTRWVLAHFGYRAGVDTVDVVLGSPRILHALDGMLHFERRKAS